MSHHHHCWAEDVFLSRQPHAKTATRPHTERATLLLPSSLTNLLLLLFGLEANDLQIAGVGDVCHDAGNPAPDAQQRPAQHVVMAQARALVALLPFLDHLAVPVPGREEDGKRKRLHPSIRLLCCLHKFIQVPAFTEGTVVMAATLKVCLKGS